MYNKIYFIEYITMYANFLNFLGSLYRLLGF